MKSIITILIITAIFSASAQAYTEQKEMTTFMKKTENSLKLQSTIDRIEKGDIDIKKLRVIYSILQNTSEYYIHNMNGVTGNQVYFHVDGHKEAVYDSNGNLVQDGINDGSYNYYDRKGTPLKHFCFDTHPWIIWGSSDKDITSQGDRIFSFVSDIELGVLSAIDSKEYLDESIENQWDNLGQIQALAIFHLALEKANSQSLYTIFEKDTSEIDGKIITYALRDLELGLNMIYQSENVQEVKPNNTSAEFQKDADIIRLKHFKYYSEILEKYHSIKGKYPFEGKENNPAYVYIANDEQIDATKNGPDYPHATIPAKEFFSELETVLGHEVLEYYDPQYRGDYKPNFYMYLVYQDAYYFSIHVHQPFLFGEKISDFYYKVEISNYISFRNRANDPKTLFQSPEFIKELSKAVAKEQFFKERENKYLKFTKKTE